MPVPRPAPGTLKWWVIGVVGVGAMTALVIWWALAATVGKASWSPVSYAPEGPAAIRLTWQVNKPVDKATTCTLQAQALDASTVGTLDVTVPAGGPATRDITTRIRTTHQAVTAKVTSCTVPR